MKKGRIIALVMVLALISSIVAAGCAAPAPAPTPAPAPAPAPAPTPAPAPAPAPTPAPSPAPAPAPAAPEEVITWIGQSSLPAGMPVTWGMEDFSKRVEAATNGRFIMKANPAGAICPATEEHKAIQTGVLDWAGSGGGYMRGDMPWAGQCIQPVGGMPPEPLQIWLDIYGCDIANKWFQQGGWDFTFIKGSGFAGPPELFGHFSKELNTVDDLSGIKMRCSGDGGTVLGNMGVGPIFMPLGEVFEAMQRGLIDAYECSSPRFDWEMGLNEVGKYIYVCPIRAPTEVYMFLVKTSKFMELPDEFKVVIEDLAVAETWDYHSKLVAGDEEAMQNFKDYGNVVQPLPPSIVEAFGQEAVKYVNGEMAKDAGYQEIAQSQRDFAKMWDELYGLPSWAKWSYME